jgi:hypothetical protein
VLSNTQKKTMQYFTIPVKIFELKGFIIFNGVMSCGSRMNPRRYQDSGQFFVRWYKKVTKRFKKFRVQGLGSKIFRPGIGHADRKLHLYSKSSIFLFWNIWFLIKIIITSQVPTNLVIQKSWSLWTSVGGLILRGLGQNLCKWLLLYSLNYIFVNQNDF